MTPARRKFVAYYRVSTARQGRSGLGLDKQQSLVQQYLERTGGRLLKSFTEVESGKRADRPQLRLALQACRVHGATLLVASFDRLSRNAAFLLTLKAGNVPIVAADLPDVNEEMVGLMAVVAQMEARMISERTKGALREWKRRNPKRKLGKPQNMSAEQRERGRELGQQAHAAKSRQHMDDLRTTFDDMKAEGITTLHGMARKLNADNVATLKARRTGEPDGVWTPMQVSRVVKYLAAADV